MGTKIMSMYDDAEISELLTQLEIYLNKYPEEVDTVKTLQALLVGDLNLSDEHLRGHITGSSWIVNQNRDKALFTLHKKLNRWLQLGGHVDEGESVLEGATREAFEESGLTNIKLISSDIYDIDIHLIPKNPKHDSHYHFDIRYMYEGDDSEELNISHESSDLKWLEVAKLKDYNEDESINRMRRKMVKL